jgi:hypothetical protein
VPPARVLGLWLQEGKHVHYATLHGQSHALPPLAFAHDVTVAQLRSWVRSVLLYQIFGSDQLSLGLAPGTPATVLVKSTEVMLGVD